ncbi:MAG: ABC transporter permease subunit [Verrucomicrobiota bacterium]
MASSPPQLLPAVLLRELRAAARRKGTYWLRTTVAAGALLTLFLHGVGNRIASTLGTSGTVQRGAELFALLHTMLSVFLMLAAPMFAADTLAREKREGTLPLLGLTPLRPFEIVLGKAAAQIVRLISLWLVCVPVLLIPLLTGGVGALDLMIALGIEFVILTCGLAGGLVATTVCQQWTQASGLALGLTVLSGGCMALAAGSATIAAYTHYAPGLIGMSSESRLWEASLGILWAASGVGPGGFGGVLSSFPSWLGTIMAWQLLAGVFCSLLLLGLALAFAGWRVKRALRPSSSPSEPARSKSKPDRRTATWFESMGERRRQSWLRRNPARWLWAKAGPGYRSRLGWMVLVVAAWVATLRMSADHAEMNGIPCLLPLALAIPMAMNSAASLRREMEEGTLELLLVTPLAASQLVTARVFEAWSLFGPALVLNLFLISAWPLVQESYSPPLLAALLAGSTSLIALPAIGIRYAVRRLHPLSGFLWSLLTAGILPFLLGMASLASFGLGSAGSSIPEPGSMACWFGLGFGLTQFALSAVWGWLAARDLELRWYTFRPFQRRPG